MAQQLMRAYYDDRPVEVASDLLGASKDAARDRMRVLGAEMILGPRAGMSARARIWNAPGRPASAEARMIAARAANGLAVGDRQGGHPLIVNALAEPWPQH